ncbi:hypothetical protein BDZ89DRAFT_932729, partial [Hymenopellis radicata]
ADCAKGGLYSAPAAGKSYDSLEPLAVTWKASCLSSSSVDIYLYAPALNSSVLNIWQGVTNEGSYNATIMQRWYKNAPNVQLQLRIVERGASPFLSTLAAGPIFNVTYVAPASGAPASADTTKTDSGVEVVGAASESSGSHITKGGVAAAVIFPLLFAAVCVYAYIRWQRRKRSEKSKAFTEHVDKRMSTISTDWKSLSAQGASAAIRNSMSVGTGPRNSSFSFGGIRPASQFDADPQMAQLRPQSQFTGGDRVSRVSFAEGTRKSGETRRSTVGQSRAFHQSFAPPLPVPTRQGSNDSFDNGILSPTQTEGPESLTPEAIRARISIAGGREDDVGPALDSKYFLIVSYIAAPPAAAMRGETLFTSSPVTSPTSAFGSSPFGNNGFSAMSPDEMLRAYAAGR